MQDLSALIAALAAQTEALNRLAASNEALVLAIVEDDEYEDDAPMVGLNGRPI